MSRFRADGDLNKFFENAVNYARDFGDQRRKQQSALGERNRSDFLEQKHLDRENNLDVAKVEAEGRQSQLRGGGDDDFNANLFGAILRSIDGGGGGGGGGHNTNIYAPQPRLDQFAEMHREYLRHNEEAAKGIREKQEGLMSSMQAIHEDNFGKGAPGVRQPSLGNTFIGAGVGAAGGSVVPGIGTVLGGLGGGLVGNAIDTVQGFLRNRKNSKIVEQQKEAAQQQIAAASEMAKLARDYKHKNPTLEGYMTQPREAGGLGFTPEQAENHFRGATAGAEASMQSILRGDPQQQQQQNLQLAAQMYAQVTGRQPPGFAGVQGVHPYANAAVREHAPGTRPDDVLSITRDAAGNPTPASGSGYIQLNDGSGRLITIGGPQPGREAQPSGYNTESERLNAGRGNDPRRASPHVPAPPSIDSSPLHNADGSNEFTSQNTDTLIQRAGKLPGKAWNWLDENSAGARRARRAEENSTHLSENHMKDMAPHLASRLGISEQEALKGIRLLSEFHKNPRAFQLSEEDMKQMAVVKAEKENIPEELALFHILRDAKGSRNL